MPGSSGLKIAYQILHELSSGPKTRVELRRALGFDVLRPSKVLDAQLQNLRVAGLVESLSKVGGGTWQIAADVTVCKHCQGRGVFRKVQ